MPLEVRRACYQRYLKEATDLVEVLRLKDQGTERELDGNLGKLQFFALPECCIGCEEHPPKKGLASKIKAVFSN
jgi:hypothetical protein